MTEIWKNIEGYEGFYQVSNEGRVKSLERVITKYNKKVLHKGIILKATLAENGYLVVNLSKHNKSKSTSIHRLVGIAFIDNQNNKPEINHIDGEKRNNSVENLEWCTRLENQRHAANNGLYPIGEKHHAAKLNEGSVRTMRILYKFCGWSKANIAKLYNVDNSTSTDIINYKSWKHII